MAAFDSDAFSTDAFSTDAFDLDASSSSFDARMQRNRRYVGVFSLAFALVGDWLLRTLESLT